MLYDGQRMSEKTPLTIEGIQIGTRHQIRVELAKHKPHLEDVDIPKSGAEVPVMALMHPVTGKMLQWESPIPPDLARLIETMRERMK